MKIHRLVKKAAVAFAGTLLSVGIVAVPSADAAGYRLIGWNNLGMHCMDADFAVLSLLPPFNTIQAQLIDPNGKLVKSASGIQVTYEAVADPSGSINTTSAGKTNFWDHEDGLFGVNLPVDAGLGGYPMPGAGNVPQAMSFDPATSEFVAYGIPIAPYDDAGRKNTYPMMKLVARDSAGTLLASTSIVLPVSDEMSCKSCHASGSGPEGLPPSGWVNDADPERDFRLNILRLHDDNRRDDVRFVSALAEVGYNPKGLEATVVENGRSILCASCHSSEALPGSGLVGIPPLTQSIHTSMAGVTDPATGLKLDDTTNRSACYTCHPGNKTRCLRGAMGAAVDGDGTMAMQCQSCHGQMKDVGAATRTGWLEEPRCDSCHTGTAMKNNGQIRYSSVFSSPGVMRAAVDPTFATNDGAPMEGLSLYRFSKGHGGLECSACHGSTHAEFPSSHDNDNIQSVATQGHKGVIAECGSCHATVPTSATGGPHGLHPIGASWVERHGDAAEHSGAAACRNCHGSDSRGTVLSRAQADRTFSTDFGTKKFFRGATIGCYACHNGPSSESTNPNRAPVVANAQAATTPLLPVTIPLVATDADGNALTMRIVSQPVHGSVGIAGTSATYYPDGSFLGLDTFTFAAWDGSIDSNLATGTVSTLGVNQPPSVSSVTATPNPVTGKTTTLLATATDDRGEAALVYTWTVVTLPSGATVKFSANGTNAAKASVATFSKSGAYGLRVTAKDASGATATRNASVTVVATTTTVVVSPSSASVLRGGTKQFTAIAKDQFGVAMSPQPAMTWTIGGPNTISSTGLAKAGTTTGTYTVTAASAGRKGTAKLTVTK